MQDTVTPFAIGLLEFSMIDLMGPDTMGVWFLILAITFSISIWAAHMIHRQARKDSENHYFFENISPAGWRDFKSIFVVITVLVVLGVILWIRGEAGVLAMAGLLFAAAAIMHQLHISYQYWMHSLVIGDDG